MHQKVINFDINADFSASRTSDSKNISQVAAYAVQVFHARFQNRGVINPCFNSSSKK